MWIIEDSRQQKDKHENKHEWWAENGDNVLRCKLPVGDYISPPKVSIDTKQGIREITQNMCGSMKEKRRFREECKLARDIGCKLIFLIEDPKYKTIDDLYGDKIWLMSKQTIPGDQLATAMHTMSNRYGVKFMFCDPAETAELINKLLEGEDG